MIVFRKVLLMLDKDIRNYYIRRSALSILRSTYAQIKQKQNYHSPAKTGNTNLDFVLLIARKSLRIITVAHID